MSLVTVGALASPNYNVTNAGPDRTFTITVSNGSTAISSGDLFPAAAVGFGGFTILIGAVEYTVAYVTSTSAAVLTSIYTGLSVPTTCVWYKWLWMQIYSNQDFQPFGATYPVSKGTAGSSAYYKKYACSLVSSAGTNFLRHPQVTIDATTDSPTFPTGFGAQYFFGLYLVDGRTLVQYFPLLNAAHVPPTTPTSLVDLGRYNQLPLQPQGAFPDFYSADEIDSRFPSLSAGQSYYAAVTGATMSRLTFGAGLSLDLLSGVLTASASTAALPVRTITASDILLSTDGVICMDCSGGPITLSFPAAALIPQKLFYVIKIDSTANAGTLDPNGAETINGAATFTLSRQYAAAIVYCTGSTFYLFTGDSSSGTIRTVSATTTILASDETVLFNTAAGNITANLPAAASLPGKLYVFKKITTDVNVATIDPNASEQIDVWTSWALALAQQNVAIRSNGTQWYEVGT